MTTFDLLQYLSSLQEHHHHPLVQLRWKLPQLLLPLLQQVVEIPRLKQAVALQILGLHLGEINDINSIQIFRNDEMNN